MNLSNLSEMTPNAPTITSVTVTLFLRYTFRISSLNIWCFLIFPSSFSFTIETPGMAISIIVTPLLPLSYNTIPDLLASITLSL